MINKISHINIYNPIIYSNKISYISKLYVLSNYISNYVRSGRGAVDKSSAYSPEGPVFESRQRICVSKGMR